VILIFLIHANIIKYCKRPFSDAAHMNEMLIANWNARVQPDDDIYCLGDFGFGDQKTLQNVLDRLMGRKYLVKGNHDKTGVRLRGWQWVKDYFELKLDDQLIVLYHYGMRVWNGSHRGSISLYGHSHGTLPGNSQSLDVGTDCWDYAPVTLAEIKTHLATLPEYTGYCNQAGGHDHHKAKK
jgi:calcineurin-like phosphoesterase family protein